MKTLLITGGAGFIGSNFIHYILATHTNYRVINFDKLTYAGNLENLKDIEKHPNYLFVKGDITNKKSVESTIKDKKIDCIVNFAAESHVDRSIKNPNIFLKTNIIGVQVLLDAALKYDVQRFIQISTDEVYGSLAESEKSSSENSLLFPNSPYSASKTSADLLVRAYFKTYGAPVIITRSSNNYGPYQFPEKLIPLMITNALENKELPVYGDGSNIRNWLYVIDNCEGIASVIQKGQIGEIYNIGGDFEGANIEIVKTILRELNKPETLIKYVKDRPGHDRRYSLDSSKIKETLGWKPRHSFEDGIEKTIRWYLENREWWKRIKKGNYKKYYKKMYFV